jgi:hypothetical protein
LIDRGEVCWYMGRLGITMRDVLTQPAARLALAQALGARFFVFGAIQQTGSFNVSTHLIDAQSGARTGTAAIHVQDHEELKLRLGELAQQMGARPAQQAQLAKQAPKTEKALNDARALLKAGKTDQAAATLAAALKDDPRNPALLALEQQANQKAQQAKLEADRRKAETDRALAVAAARKKQQDLAKQVAQARLEAERAAKTQSDAARKAQEAQRAKAAEQLRARAKLLAAKGDHVGAVQALQGATALKADDASFRELAQARAAAEAAQKQKLDAERKKRDDDERKRRDAAAQRVAAERAARARAEADRRKAQDAHDQSAHDALLKQAKDLLAKKQYDQAVSAAESARRLKNSDEATKLARQARDAAVLAEAERKSAAGRAEAARKLEEERKKRDADQARLRQNQQAYTAALDAGRTATAQKRYDEAVASYQSAVKLFRTDAALAGLKQAQDLQAKEKTAAELERKQKLAEAQKATRIKDLLGQGQQALGAKQYDKAVAAYREVTKLQPGHVDALAGLSKAERERDAEADRLRRDKDLKARQAEFDKLVVAGKAHLQAKRWPQAQTSLRQAVNLFPGNVVAKQLLAQADAGVASMKTPPIDPKLTKQKADYDLAMSAGRDAVKKNNLPGAQNSFKEALRIVPGDKAATEALGSVERLLRMAQDAEVKKKQTADEMKRQAVYNGYMALGQSAMKAKKYAAALKAFTEALKVKPNDPAALQGQKEAQQGLKTPAVPPRPPVAPKMTQRDADYLKAMTAAQTLLKANNYPGAVAALDLALKAKPGDPVATALRADAQKKAAAAAQQEYARWMAAGAALEKQKKWADAVAAYTAALGKMPGDARATAALRGAAYQLHMTNGQAAHAMKKYAEAVKSYTEALKLMPASMEAKAALDKARAGKP